MRTSPCKPPLRRLGVAVACVIAVASCGNPVTPTVPASHYRTLTIVNDLPQPVSLVSCGLVCAAWPGSLQAGKTSDVEAPYGDEGVGNDHAMVSHRTLGCLTWRIARTEWSPGCATLPVPYRGRPVTLQADPQPSNESSIKRTSSRTLEVCPRTPGRRGTSATSEAPQSTSSGMMRGWRSRNSRHLVEKDDRAARDSPDAAARQGQ